MPLADKIMELRKKQGWSQIDLADRLDVSRQSVSKWEMAQAVPELDKIIKMSELFAVTTDYLLKDDTPAPETGPQPEPGPAPEPDPEPKQEPVTPPKPRRKMWPWVVAAVLAVFVLPLALALALSSAGIDTYQQVKIGKSTPAPVEVTYPPDGQTVIVGVPTPTPAPETVPLDEAVVEEPAVGQTAVSDPDNVEDGMTEYVYEGESVTAGGFDEKTLAAIAAEYEPYGLTCDEAHHWYLGGVRIRTFTDVLTTNGESLTGGDFHGTLRTFSGDGFLDVRAVRDYEHCGDDGCGTLLYLESRDVRQDGDQWTEHYALGHHDEGHHE